MQFLIPIISLLLVVIVLLVIELKKGSVQLKYLVSIHHQNKRIMADLTQLQKDVAANNDAVQSAVTLLQGLKSQLDAAGTDPQKLAELSSSIEASTQALAAAVTANTPAAPQG